MLEPLISKSSSIEGYAAEQQKQCGSFDPVVTPSPLYISLQQDAQSSSGSLNPFFHVLTAEVFFGLASTEARTAHARTSVANFIFLKLYCLLVITMMISFA